MFTKLMPTAVAVHFIPFTRSLTDCMVYGEEEGGAGDGDWVWLAKGYGPKRFRVTVRSGPQPRWCVVPRGIASERWQLCDVAEFRWGHGPVLPASQCGVVLEDWFIRGYWLGCTPFPAHVSPHAFALL